MTSTKRRLLTLSTPLVLALGLTGCGNDDGGDGSGATNPPPVVVTPGDTATATPGEDGDDATDAPVEGDGAATPDDLAARLLDAADLPAGLGAWRVGPTGPAGDGIGECQQFAFTDVGAVDAVEREYDGGEEVDAEQVVAQFADAKSAERTQQVLRSWHEDCVDFLRETDDDEGVEVGDLVDLTTEDGWAASYSVTTTDDGREVETEVVALAQRGTLVSVVVLDVDGPEPAGAGEALAVAALARL